MLISPPFLPARGNLTEAQWLDAAMAGGEPGDGAYPLSFNLGWHGGIHLAAPANGNQSERVRAIADGTVVFVRQPTARVDDPNHPQNYRGGWTDNGCVVLRHETEIGEGANATIIFFSIVMHLDEIAPAIRNGRAVHRKAVLGRAGQIYGSTQRKVHFEIVCDETNLAPIVGRSSGNLPTNADGRANVVFGEIYFHLTGAQSTLDRDPIEYGKALRAAQARARQRHQPVPTELPNPPRSGGELRDVVVGIRYDRGSAITTLYSHDGQPITGADGRPVPLANLQATVPNAEYSLYERAKDIIDHQRANAQGGAAEPAPSAVYELLRFGRVINTTNETLSPADTPNWQQVNHAGSMRWVNVNAAGIRKFSDADFPHWKGWKLVRDDADGNNQCNSPTIRAWLDADGDGNIVYEASPESSTTREARQRLEQQDLQNKLRFVVGKFPTEWQGDAAAVERRFGWLRAATAENANPMNEASFNRLRDHVAALAFWGGANTGIEANDVWHLHPKEFIRLFRACGWLSGSELARVYPDSEFPVEALTREGRGRTPSGIRDTYRLSINRVMRKYLVNTPSRMTHFFGQGAVESMYLSLMVEGSASFSRNPAHASFQPEGADYYRPTRPNDYLYYLEGRLGNVDRGDGPKFRGRGMKQLTGRENYAKYWVYRGWLDSSSFDAGWWRDPTRLRAPNVPDPQRLSVDSYNAIDAGGWYWEAGAASNNFRSINSIIDSEVIDRRSVLAVARAINGVNRATGEPNGLAERITATTQVAAVLMDTV